jgi:hypothetical protein
MIENAATSRRISFLGYGACLVAGCLWGTGFYFGRLALNEMSVEHMVLYRFLFACLGMLPVALLHRRRVRLTGSEVRLLLIYGQPRIVDGGRDAGVAGRGGPALCRRQSSRRAA